MTRIRESIRVKIRARLHMSESTWIRVKICQEMDSKAVFINSLYNKELLLIMESRRYENLWFRLNCQMRMCVLWVRSAILEKIVCNTQYTNLDRDVL